MLQNNAFDLILTSLHIVLINLQLALAVEAWRANIFSRVCLCVCLCCAGFKFC